MNRAGGHLLSAQGLSSFLLCCYQPAFSSFLFHGLQFAQIAVFDITCKHKNKQVWEHAACGVQPWEDTGLGILRRKKLFLSVCVSLLKPLSWTAPSWLIGWSWATCSCPHQQLQGQSLTMCPKAGVWGHRFCHVGIRENVCGSGEPGGVVVGCQQHFPPVLCWLHTEQRVSGCRLLESKPLSTLLPSDSRHTWFCLNLEPVCNHVLLGT